MRCLVLLKALFHSHMTQFTEIKSEKLFEVSHFASTDENILIPLRDFYHTIYRCMFPDITPKKLIDESELRNLRPPFWKVILHDTHTNNHQSVIQLSILCLEVRSPLV